MSKDSIRVLLFEDDPGDVDFLREIFSEARNTAFELKHVTTLRDGMELLNSDAPNAILLDLNLPDSQGKETFDKLYSGWSSLPIVVLTGNDDDASALRAVKSGAQDYLVKGRVDYDSLARSLRYAIERHGLQTELEKSRLAQQQRRERAEAVRHFHHYLALGEDEERGGLAFRPNLNDHALRQLVPDYRNIVLKYVRAIRVREARPKELVRQFSTRLAAMQVRARDVVHLHLDVLTQFSQRALPAEERSFSNDARLVIVELMGNLLDCYRNGHIANELRIEEQE